MRQPERKFLLRHHDHLADHLGVIGAAVLRAEQVIRARLGRLEPDRGVAARDYVHLRAECGNIKGVQHVLRNQRHAHGFADGNV